jgi:hypothetical protein
MPDRVYRTSPYRPFSAFLPYDLKNVRIDTASNGEGFFDPLNEKIDLEWGGSRDDQAFNNYYDYFFSGEDIKYDAMMMGTRLITGELSVYTRYPRRMTSLLEKAAKKRTETSQGLSTSVISYLGSDYERKDDELNIEKYWLNSQLDRITTDPQANGLIDGSDPTHNIFSAHPPFNLVVNRNLNSDRILATDMNERKTVTNALSGPMKIVLQNVHLMSMTTAYSSGGQPLVENYQFIARDMYMSGQSIESAKTRASVPDITEEANATANETTVTITG